VQLEASSTEQRSELERHATAQSETFEQRLAEQEAETGLMRRELDEQRALIAGREETLRRSETELDGLRSRHEEDKGRFERVSRELRDANAKLRSGDHDADVLRDQLAARTTALQQAREESTAQRAELESSRIRFHDVTQALRDKEREAQQLALAAGAHDEDNEAQSQRIRTLEGELTAESAVLTQLRDRGVALEEELARLRKEVALAYGEIQRLHGIASQHDAQPGKR